MDLEQEDEETYRESENIYVCMDSTRGCEKSNTHMTCVEGLDE